MRVAAARGVPLVEDEVEHRQHGAQPLGQQVIRRHAEGDARRRGSSAWRGRAAAPSSARRRGTRGRSPRVVRPPTSRSVSAICASAASAGWQHVKISAQPVVRDRAHARRPRPGGLEPRAAAPPCGRSVRSRRMRSMARLRAVVTIQAPGLRGSAVPRPALERGRERVLHGVLGELEVAEDADEDRDCTAPLLAEDLVDGRGRRRPPGQRSITGRISIDPYSAAGTIEAIRIASSRSGSRVRKSPPISSLVSANGPSVTIRSPWRTRTTLASARGLELDALLSGSAFARSPRRRRSSAASTRRARPPPPPRTCAPRRPGRCRRAARTASQALTGST